MPYVFVLEKNSFPWSKASYKSFKERLPKKSVLNEFINFTVLEQYAYQLNIQNHIITHIHRHTMHYSNNYLSQLMFVIILADFTCYRAVLWQYLSNLVEFSFISFRN